MQSINDTKYGLTCLVVFQILNDAVYDYSDYVKDPDKPLANETLIRIVCNFFTILIYYYIYRRNRDLLEMEKKKNIHFVGKAEDSQDFSDDENLEYMAKA